MSTESSKNQQSDPATGLLRSAEAGRLAHAYLVVGAPEREGMSFAKATLTRMFCAAPEKACGTCAGCRGVEGRSHPDILWIEPEKKSRVIAVDQIRAVNRRLSQSSYEGGWKAAVIICADRLNDESANAFLKTLEEPPGRSLLLLLTDSPQALLPTIVSRCQRIALTERQEEADRPWLEPLLDILRAMEGGGPLDSTRLASRLNGLLDGEKKRIAERLKEETAEDGQDDDGIADARVEAKLKAVREAILQLMLRWQRDVFLVAAQAGEDLLHNTNHVDVIRRQATSLGYTGALARLRSVEVIARRLERHLPAQIVFEQGLRHGIG